MKKESQKVLDYLKNVFNDYEKTENKLNATNQQLTSNEQQLRAANQQLEANNQQLITSEQEIKKHAHDLEERIKELGCFYGISETVRKRKTIEEILQDITKIIPPAWQYPEITCAKISFGNMEYKTDNYEDSKWKLSSDIMVKRKIAGKIEVCYLEQRSQNDIDPFLKEERTLLDNITERLGRIIERKNAEEELKATNQLLNANNQQLAATEQQLRAANQQLRASEELAQTALQYADNIIETLREPFLVLDNDLKVVSANQSFYNNFKVSVKNTVGRYIYELGNNQWDIPALRKLLEDILPEKTIITDYEVEHTFDEIGRKIMLLNVKQLIRKKGKEKLILFAIEDITVMKDAEEKLKATNQQLSATEQQLRATNQQLIASEQQTKKEKQFSENLLITANAFILTLDLNANITLFNKFAEKLTGYKKEEVLGKNWFNLFIPKQNGTIIPEVFANVLIEMPEVSSYENPVLCKNGSERLISWENTVLNDENGEVSGILSIGTDITERKQAEGDLKKRMNELEIFNEATVGRELKINEHRKEINELLGKLGKKAKYEIPV